MPEAQVLAWPEALALGDGWDTKARSRADATARRWLKEKRCDLLVSGRVKSSHVVALTFTPLNHDSQSNADTDGMPQSYHLSDETMDFPIAFLEDVGAAIAACALAQIRIHERHGLISTIEAIEPRLSAFIETAALPDEGLTKFRLLDCLALARIVLFDYRGQESDLRKAIEAGQRALTIIDRQQNGIDWAKAQNRTAGAIARLGDHLGDVSLLRQAIGSMREALEYLSTDLLLWTQVQFNLATAHSHIFFLVGSRDALQLALDILDQISTDELRDRDEMLWSGVQHNLGAVLFEYGRTEAGDDAVMRAFDAFGLPLELRTVKIRHRRSDTLVNLAVALIELGVRQSALDPHFEAIRLLEEAEELTSIQVAPRKWLLIQLNLGNALAFAGRHDPALRTRAVSVLRIAQSRSGHASPTVQTKVALSLSKALLFKGGLEEKAELLKEARNLLEGELARTKTGRLYDRLNILNDLGLIHYHFGLLEDNIDSLRKSAAMFEQCSTFDIRVAPFLWVTSRLNFSLTLRALGESENSLPRFEESVQMSTSTFSLMSQETAPVLSATAHFYCAGTFYQMAKRELEPRFLEDAERECAAALALLPQPYGHIQDDVRRLAERIEALANSGLSQFGG